MFFQTQINEKAYFGANNLFKNLKYSKLDGRFIETYFEINENKQYFFLKSYVCQLEKYLIHKFTQLKL